MVEAPSAEQLRSLQDGDYALLRPPPSKADQFGLHWGASTIYLRFFADAAAVPICAARELAAEELRRMVPAARRVHTPLFSPTAAGSTPWTHGQLDGAMSRMLTVLEGAEAAKGHSVHSFRIYLACALLEAGASSGTIQCMLRWRSDDALRIYARINDYRYADWLDAAASARVSSVRTTTRVVQEMEDAATGPTGSREAGFQQHWQAMAGAAADTLAARAATRPVTDRDDVVMAMQEGMAGLLVSAAAADAEDDAGAWRGA